MKFKVLALIMALLIALLTLASCGGNEETTTAPEEKTTSAPAGEKETLGDYYETDEVLGEELPME